MSGYLQKVSWKYFNFKLVTELLALCPKRCIKVYSLFSPTFLVRVFRQCTFARYVLNGHNYFCLQDNEIRCCEVKPREKIMETNTFWSCKHKIHFTPIWNILIFNKAGGTRGVGGYFDQFKSETFSIKRPCDTRAVAPHSFEILWNCKNEKNCNLTPLFLWLHSDKVWVVINGREQKK